MDIDEYRTAIILKLLDALNDRVPSGKILKALANCVLHVSETSSHDMEHSTTIEDWVWPGKWWHCEDCDVRNFDCEQCGYCGQSHKN